MGKNRVVSSQLRSLRARYDDDRGCCIYALSRNGRLVMAKGDRPTPLTHREVRKGRGAPTNASGRYEAFSREAVDDGWGALDAPLDNVRREEIVDRSRTIITTNRSPDLPFERSVNPYRGCEHGCIYCFARPTHAYLGFSPGLDFETRIVYKPEATVALRRELARPGYRPKTINFGTNTDPYQPIERSRRITRSMLEVLLECRHPVAITTKSTLIERDIDLLEQFAHHGLIQVWLSIPTLNDVMSRPLEPRTAAPRRRLKTIERLTAAGIDVGVLVAPVIPLLTDGEIQTIVRRAREAGARAAGYVLLRLPLEVRELFEQWLEVHHPGKAAHVMKLVRDTRGGQNYQSEFGLRQRGSGAYAALIGQRFRLAERNAGLSTLSPLRTDLFRPPTSSVSQLSLFQDPD